MGTNYGGSTKACFMTCLADAEVVCLFKLRNLIVGFPEYLLIERAKLLYIVNSMVDLFGSTPQTFDDVLLTREECCALPFKPYDPRSFRYLVKNLDPNSFRVTHR